jgi:hypothetical protein
MRVVERGSGVNQAALRPADQVTRATTGTVMRHKLTVYMRPGGATLWYPGRIHSTAGASLFEEAMQEPYQRRLSMRCRTLAHLLHLAPTGSGFPRTTLGRDVSHKRINVQVVALSVCVTELMLARLLTWELMRGDYHAPTVPSTNYVVVVVGLAQRLTG